MTTAASRPGLAGLDFASAPLASATLPPSRLPAGFTLSERLTAVARLVQIGTARAGPDGFDPALLQEAEELLARSGERLRLSAEHTIVVLAGGTGSGKSSLFNLLAGADFSPSGAVRPMTREPHACVWGMAGAGPLLDWLGVPPRHRYARSSALDEGERSLAGLLLLDLPDHDSVLAGETNDVSKLVGLADMMVWVLDPQKYADAAVHSRYLVPLAGHSAVISVVLNQADLLAPPQVEDCEADLRRLLESEGLPEARVVVTSATTGAGIEDLRKLLVETMLDRQAAVSRIAANVDAIAERFVPYAGGPGAIAAGTSEGDAALKVEPASVKALAEAFARAAGIDGVGAALRSARELRAADYLGSPMSWLADRLIRRDPVRKIRLGALWDELRGVSASAAGAQRSEIDNAITALADMASRPLPTPWPHTTRTAARSRADQIPAALGAAVSAALPTENKPMRWWLSVAAWQGLLAGAAVAGVAWLAAIAAFGVFHLSHHVAGFLRDLMAAPWIGLGVVLSLVLGQLTASGCMSVVARATAREAEQAQDQMREGIADVARRFVVAPVEQEFSEFARFQAELASARGLA